MSRPSDMAPVETLATGKPHGHKMRYMAGCRCDRCRRGNAVYEQKLHEDRKLYGSNDLVSTVEVKAHLHWLMQSGMGPMTIGKAAGVGKTGLREILYNGKSHMRRRAANRVLAVRPSIETLPKSASIPAADTLEMISQLTNWGYPKSLINRDALGNNSAGLQIVSLNGGPSVVMVRTALLVRDFFRKVERMRALWISLGRSIPSRHFVYWRTGCQGFTRRSLELRPFHAAYAYNYVYPPELKAAMGMASQLKHQIRGMRNAA